MDGGAWWAAVHGVAEGQTRLSDFTLTFHFHALEKEMATHSSVLSWRIPGNKSLVDCHLWGCIFSQTQLKRLSSSSSSSSMTGMKIFGQVQYPSQTLPMVCNLPTPVSPRRQWISAAASPNCCQGNKRGQKKSSMTFNFKAVKTPLKTISTVL